MKSLLIFMLMALIFPLPASAEIVAPASLQEVQASLKKDLSSVTRLHMMRIKSGVVSEVVRGNGVEWVAVLADPKRYDIAAHAVNSNMVSREKFDKIVAALEKGRTNAGLLGTPEGNKLAFTITQVLKIVEELKLNPKANSQDWHRKGQDLLVYLR